MKNYRLGLTTDVRNTIIEKDKTRKKRLWSTMSPKQKAEMDIKVRKRMMNYRLGLSPEKKAEMIVKASKGMMTYMRNCDDLPSSEQKN